jgi:hypothetical protein
MFFQPKDYKMKLAITIALIACALQAIGQTHIQDPTMEKEFADQVKSIDEFIARFNGKEVKPSLRTDSVRRDNILSLFDFQMSHGELDASTFKKHLSDFTREAIKWNDQLSISSNGTIAEAICIFKHEGKEKEIILLLQRESTSKGNQKWAICGATGLEKWEVFNDKRVTISPVDHETHFMSLHDFFLSNRKLIPSLRAKDKDIDQLSFLFGLCATKCVEFRRVKKLRFHFLDIPNYIFIVEEIGRKGNNCGWLITHLEKADAKHKSTYTNLLFNQAYK